MSKIISDFAAYLANDRHYSPYTVTCYKSDLQQWTDFLAQSGEEPLSANKESVNRWIAHMLSERYERQVQNRKLATLRSFYRWASDQALVKGNPTRGVQTMKEARNG